MAGNTRGKLKEHFIGIHKNIDWAIAHAAKSATLIENQLALLPTFAETGGDPEKEKAFFLKHPMYEGVTALGEALVQLDEIAQGIYQNI
jgi:hypothetical protein